MTTRQSVPWAPFRVRIPVIASLALFASWHIAHGQDLVLEERIEVSGVVDALQPGQLWIRDADGQVLRCKIQLPDDEFVALGGTDKVIDFPAAINVKGTLDVNNLEERTWITFDARLGFRGTHEGEISRIGLVDVGGRTHAVSADEDPTREIPFVDATVVGTLIRIRNNLLIVDVGRSKLARSSRLTLPLAENAVVEFSQKDLGKVKRGDSVRRATVARFNTGDLVIQSIDIDVHRAEAVAEDASDEFEEKYARFSDEDMPPRDVRSAHFILHTDISDRSAAILLDKLERMIELVSAYYQRPPRKLIECYVIRDLEQWPTQEMDPDGIRSIEGGGGVTRSQTLGRDTTSVVYSCDNHGVVQHESVHAYCAQTFGSTGPVWYAEGMAEMGQYWREDEKAVRIDPAVAQYLSRAEKRDILAIVAAGQITGDSWQAYAWRWALCHLLANNPNYNGRFRALGVGMMSRKPVSFETAYGDVANQIVFEYGQFVQHLGNGLRADLTAWQWNHRFVPLRPRRRVHVDVQAAYGWQATGVQVDRVQEYTYTSEGEWKIAESATPLDADGLPEGSGRLVAVVMKEFELSDPFELGVEGTFQPPASGNLYVRCRDAWTELADNSGEVRLTLQRSDR